VRSRLREQKNRPGHAPVMALSAVLFIFQAASTPMQSAPVTEPQPNSGRVIAQPLPEPSRKEIVGLVLEITGKWSLSWNGSTLELHQGDAIPNSARVVPQSKEGSIVIGLVDINGQRLRFAAADGPSSPIRVASPPSGIENWIYEAIDNLTNTSCGWIDPISRSVQLQCRTKLLKTLWSE